MHLQLGAEDDAIFRGGVENRLLADAIAGEQKLALARIPKRDGKHAAQAAETILAVFFVEMNDGFGVGMRGEFMPAGFEILAQLGVIVNFAVEHDPELAVFVRERLMAAFEIDDAEAAETEAETAHR